MSRSYLLGEPGTGSSTSDVAWPVLSGEEGSCPLTLWLVPLVPSTGNVISITNVFLCGKQTLSVTEQVMYSFSFPHYQALRVLWSKRTNQTDFLFPSLPAPSTSMYCCTVLLLPDGGLCISPHWPSGDFSLPISTARWSLSIKQKNHVVPYPLLPDLYRVQTCWGHILSHCPIPSTSWRTSKTMRLGDLSSIWGSRIKPMLPSKCSKDSCVPVHELIGEKWRVFFLFVLIFFPSL